MVKHAFFSLIAVIAAIGVSAQGLEELPEENYRIGGGVVEKSYVLSVGPKLGINYSMAGDPDLLSLGMGGSVGFDGGVAANIHFGRRKISSPSGTGWFGLQLEAQYSMRTLSTNSDNIRMNGLIVPLLAQCYVHPNLCIEVGPTFYGAFGASPEAFQYDSVIFSTGEMRGNDVMLTLGIGYKSRRGFTASVRYNMGNSDLAPNFPTKVSTISVGIGWMFSVVK